METHPTAALGFRAWIVDRQRLCSVINWMPWPESVIRAECDFCQGPYPSSECECGMYAYHSVDLATSHTARLMFTGSSVIGAVAGKGRIEVHSHGFRSEEMQILALALPFGDAKNSLTELAEFYGLLTFESAGELRDYAHCLSMPIPQRLRPDETTPPRFTL